MKYRIFCVFDPDESGSNWNYTKVWFYIWPSACYPFQGPQYNTMLKRGEKLSSTLNNYKYRLRANFQWAGKIPIWNVWRHNWKEVEACKFIHCNLIHTTSLLECYNTNQDDTLGRHTWKLANSSTATWFHTTSLLVIITTKMDGIWWREGRRRPCESVMRHWEDAPQWPWLLIHILNKQPNIITINKAHIWQLHRNQF